MAEALVSALYVYLVPLTSRFWKPRLQETRSLASAPGYRERADRCNEPDEYLYAKVDIRL